MKRQALLVTLAVTSILMAAIVVFIFNDSKPKFLSGREGKVELVKTNFYALAGSTDMFLMREWRVWPDEKEDIFTSAMKEFPKSKGWGQFSGKGGGTEWLQLSSPDGNVTIIFEEGSWRVYEAGKTTKLDYYKAWIRSAGKIELTAPQIRVGGASPKAGSPSKSP